MFDLKTCNLHWVGDDPHKDLCAHGSVLLLLDGEPLADEDGVCVSAAALYLLRTLHSNHNSDTRVGDHLLPCCGHDMHANDGEDDVMIVECPNGYDWIVQHAANETVELRFENGVHTSLSTNRWHELVCQFSKQIENFYEASAVKQPHDEYQAAGYNQFRSEWARRVNSASKWKLD